jgi:shikimate dehydrogenase
MTTVYGIFGWPVAHSLSPAMHNAAFHALGLDSVYVPFAVPPERLAQAVGAIVHLELKGVNLTLPHKHAALGMLDEVEETARLIGAVNCISHDGGRLVGFNTDAPGLVRALEAEQISVSHSQVAVIGAGGAARAAVVGLAQAGASQIAVLARRFEQAERLVAELRPQLNATLVAADLLSASQDILEHSQLVIQASSATLHDDQQAQAFVSQLRLATLPSTAVIVDLVYSPTGTALSNAAAARGLRAFDGRGMLLHQGAIAFERWVGQPAPLSTMQAQLTAFF